MIVVAGTLRLPVENLEAARPLIAALVAATRQEDGCLSYAFCQDLGDPSLLHVAETWRDAEALAAHGKTSHIARWRAASGDLGIHERRIWAYDAAEPRPL